MTGLSKITDKIRLEAEEEAKARLAAADAECAAVTDEYRRRTDALREAMNAEARTEAEEIVSRAKAGVETGRRNRMLEVRSEQLDRAFALAKKAILEMSQEEYLEFLTALLVATVKRQAADEALGRTLYGDEDVPEIRQYEVLLASRDLARYGKPVLREAGHRLAGQVEDSMLAKLVLSEESAGIEGGLILRCGNVEINNSLAALFSQVRPSMEAAVEHKLFSDD